MLQPLPPPTDHANYPYAQFTLDFEQMSEKVKVADKESHPLFVLVPFLDNFQKYAQIYLSALSLVTWHHVKDKRPNNRKVFIMLINHPSKEIQEIKSHQINYFITIEVVIVRTGPVRLLAHSALFTCQTCRGQFRVYFSHGIYKAPTNCKSKMSCKGKNFVQDKYHIDFVTYQRLKVQEINHGGGIPRTMEVEVRQNLAKRAVSGNLVRISGVLKTLEEAADKMNQAIFAPVLLANSITKVEISLDGPRESSIVTRMRQDKNIFFSLIRSFCPSIYGKELVKAGLLLTIASYSPDSQDGMRGSHVLLVGDPGLGKSQLMKYAVSLVSNSQYFSGNSISGNGLTATVTPEKDGAALEAGALVLCDQGICAIDQFDKIADNAAVLEVAEQQRVTVAKGGIVCQLRARASIVASANPKSGMFDKNKSFRDNIKINSAILTRFDIIFLLLDQPNTKNDRIISEHIVNMRRASKDPLNSQSSYASSNHGEVDSDNLAAYYAKAAQHHGTLYPHDDMKIYLKYVRVKAPQPKLTIEASETIKYYYMSLRDKPPCQQISVTARQLQSFVRLCKARARLQCLSEVSRQMAEEVMTLLEQSMFKSLQEMRKPTNAVKGGGKNSGKPTGQLSIPKQTKIFLEKLAEIHEQDNKQIFSLEQLISVANQLQMKVGDFRDYMDMLNERGNFLRQNGKYKLVIKYMT